MVDQQLFEIERWPNKNYRHNMRTLRTIAGNILHWPLIYRLVLLLMNLWSAFWLSQLDAVVTLQNGIGPLCFILARGKSRWTTLWVYGGTLAEPQSARDAFWVYEATMYFDSWMRGPQYSCAHPPRIFMNWNRGSAHVGRDESQSPVTLWI